MNIYNSIENKAKKNIKSLIVLIDPDKITDSNLEIIINKANSGLIDYIFVGSSILLKHNIDEIISKIKNNTKTPIVIFPGNTMQISKYADAILFLSLISGRNADLLIGNHVLSAPIIKNYNLEAIPTGYILIDSGKMTSVVYMSNTTPIPSDKNDIAIATSMAGEMLGLKVIYMDAGSGAANSITLSMIKEVKNNINIPLIIGGGIKDRITAENIYKAGADCIVIGNSIETSTDLIDEISKARNI